MLSIWNTVITASLYMDNKNVQPCPEKCTIWADKPSAATRFSDHKQHFQSTLFPLPLLDWAHKLGQKFALT